MPDGSVEIRGGLDETCRGAGDRLCPAVSHILTRVMEVYVKEGDKGKRRAAHWLAIDRGSGTSQSAEWVPSGSIRTELERYSAPPGGS